MSKLSHIIGTDGNKKKIYGRKTKIKEINYDEASTFLDRNHIEGKTSATVYIGAFMNEEIVGVITLLMDKENDWILSRMATDYDYICCGVVGKMFSFFKKKYSPICVKSFADRRWTFSNGNNIYTRLGFNLVKVVEPNYRYVIDGGYKRINPSDVDFADISSMHKIWDCGLYEYEWRKV